MPFEESQPVTFLGVDRDKFEATQPPPCKVLNNILQVGLSEYFRKVPVESSATSGGSVLMQSRELVAGAAILTSMWRLGIFRV